MRFSTIRKFIQKQGFDSFDEYLKVIDTPSELGKPDVLNKIIAFARYTLIHNKCHEASSKAAKKREAEYIEHQNKERKEKWQRYLDGLPECICSECYNMERAPDDSSYDYKCDYLGIGIIKPTLPRKCHAFKQHPNPWYRG